MREYDFAKKAEDLGLLKHAYKLLEEKLRVAEEAA